ncbi:hypothetical protein Dthio_PD2019 [Desulfonatronospira thiodismutans ASO3-1]|uniref:Uncharacterized protein n=1 Tax=Desulfonatronospira thiodismutans ASO3-1 TaxID=555779 RepID=D6SPH1_9BACT|nr:hypothetical protein Dthio_PD2019 [Desulfonatronospira thiodismutans ASO3-1]
MLPATLKGYDAGQSPDFKKTGCAVVLRLLSFLHVEFCGRMFYFFKINAD